MANQVYHIVSSRHIFSDFDLDCHPLLCFQPVLAASHSRVRILRTRHAQLQLGLGDDRL